MYVQENVPLSGYSTMRLGGPARFLTEIDDRFAIAGAMGWARERNVQVMMIGQGSNIVWGDKGFPGLVLVNRIKGFETFQQDETYLYVTVGAGENWDEVVARCVELGYSGVEQLSLIPGTAGATPVQNVGAYGREIKDILVTIEAYDTEQGQLVTLRADECAFGYRTSRFKTSDRGRFFITSVTLHLSKTPPSPPFYGALEKYFAEHSITTYTPSVIRDAVIAIRKAKLPDPELVANNGSFFANPIISPEQFSQLQAAHQDIPHWDTDDGNIKLSAAWLVEQAGFKDVHDAETGMATWASQPLVLVNEHATSTANLIQFRDKIMIAVSRKFHVRLEQEPELINT